MPSGTGTVLLEQKVLNQSVVARVQLKQQSIWEPRTGQEASLLSGKIILLFAVMRNGFALYCRAPAMAAGTREGSARQQHSSLCEGITPCSEQTMPEYSIG